jgi:branched-chain amino acid transport system permease protein
MLFGVVIGGMHSLSGALLGAVFLKFFPDLVAPLGKGLSALLYAVLLIGAMVAMPNGIAGALSRFIRSFRWRVRANASAAKDQALSPSAD